MAINSDRKAHAELVNKGVQGRRAHRRVMLEHGVHADHTYVVGREQVMDALRLRHAVQYAARAQHLERMQHHDAPAQAGQRHGRYSVDPA